MSDSLQYLSSVQDLVDLHEFMQDEELAEAMDIAIKCIAKPDMPPAVARIALLKMQGLAFRFKMQGAYYTHINKGSSGTSQNIKKNVYFSASDQCHELAQTLKYLVKEHF